MSEVNLTRARVFLRDREKQLRIDPQGAWNRHPLTVLLDEASRDGLGAFDRLEANLESHREEYDLNKNNEFQRGAAFGIRVALRLAEDIRKGVG